jgi:hypothetical protein
VLNDAPGPALLGIAWNGTRYVAVGDASAVSGDPRTIVTSPDAFTWEYETLPPAINAAGLAAVVWTGSQFVTVGGFGAALTSPNGIEWTSDFTGTSGFFSTLAFANGECVAGGIFGLIMVNRACGGDTIFASGFEP